MRIVINSSIQRFGGAIQVVLSFVNECKNFPDNDYIIWVGPGLRPLLNEKSFPQNFTFVHFDFGIIDLVKSYSIQRTLRNQEIRDKPDVMYASSGPTYYLSLCPQIIGYNLGQYVYHESPFIRGLSPYRALRRRIKEVLHIRSFLKTGNAYVVQTDDVKTRIERLYGFRNVFVVSNTASAFYRKRPVETTAFLPDKESNEFRFITISSYYGHKNFELIPEVLNSLEAKGITNIKFVLTLPDEQFQRFIGQHPNILNMGPIKPADCPGLYQECDALFLPTLLECFSASYAEAMIMEKPIVTTSMGFAKSICQDAALYFEPKNAESAASAIMELINDQELRKRLVQNGLARVQHFDTPSQRAEKYLRLCEALVGGKVKELVL